jgi:hypothetical protein
MKGEPKMTTDFQIPESILKELGRDKAERIRRRHLDRRAHIAVIAKGMTKAKCRELYEQMETAISAFEDALEALSGQIVTGMDERGRVMSSTRPEE